MAAYRFLFLSLFLLLQVSAGVDIERIGPKNIGPAQQTYDWSPQYFCRLLAHHSTVLKNSDHHVLVFDGGMGKYRFNWNGKDVEVLDLNGWTVVIDLSKDFNTQDYGSVLVSQTKKAIGVPSVNRAAMWADATQNSIFSQGGHFHEAPFWNESLYYVNDSDIPPYSIWKFDLLTKTWTDITKKGNNKDAFRRATGGAGVSVPSLNKSYYIGGIRTTRTQRDAPVEVFTPQTGMLVYNHKDDSLSNETYGTADEEGFGFWHGSLDYMNLGGGKGFLISLMGEKALGGTFRPDLRNYGDETGDSVDFTTVLLYSLDEERWFKQKTTYINDEKPATRSRFCGKVVYSNSTNTWEFWVYGGQNITDKSQGIDDIYVLSMPSFIWTKIKFPIPEVHVRSHSCHVIGSQLLVVGGYPPGYTVEPDAPCSQELIRVLDMNTVSWRNSYKTNTIYRTPEEINKRAEISRREPYSTPWADSILKEAFDYPPPPPPPPKPSATPNSSSSLIGDAGALILTPQKIVVVAISCIIAILQF